MRIESKTASLIFKVVLVVVGAIGLGRQFGDPYLWYYFTNLSNLAVLLYFAADIIYLVINRADDTAITLAPRVKYACTMAITVTFLVAHFMLDGGMVFVDGVFQPNMLIVHYFVPILTIADWLLFDKKGTMGKFDPFIWVLLPLIYLVYVLITVYGFGISMCSFNLASRFPYPFIDIDAQGVPVTCITVVLMVVFFAGLGYVYTGIDHLMASKSRKQK